MAEKDDVAPLGRVAGFDDNGIWHDPGNGQFAKPGWSTAKGLALGLVGLIENLTKDRGDKGLLVHPKGDSLKSLGVGSGDTVRARYLDSKHAMVEIVRDGKLIQRKVAWNTLDRPAVDTPDTPDVVETQAAEFAARLIAHSAGTDPAIDAELLDTVRTMFNHDLGDGYTSQVENATFAPGFSAFINLHGAINYNGVKVGTFSRTLFSKPGEDGTPGVEVDHGALAIHADHQGKGVGSRFFAASMTAYRANGIDRVATYAVSGAGTMNGAYTWAKAGFDWDLRGNERYKLATIGYRMLEADPESSIGKALSEWDGSTRDALPTPLEVALDPTGADVLKAKDASLSWSGIIQVRPTANVDVPTPVDVAPDPGDVPPVGTPFDGFAGRMATRVGFGDDALDDELIATAKQMFEHDLGDGHRSVVEVARFNAKGDLYISGQITNGRRNIGSFSRGITPAGIADANGYRGVEVGHGSLRLVPEAQGQGTGSRFFAASMDAYRAAGIDRVSVTASSDRSHNGAYTWAKAGFEWDQRPNQAYRARDIGELMLAVDPDSTIGRALRTWEDNQPLPEGFPSPLEVALDPTGAQVLKTGNVFWNGSIDLSDEAQAATAALADAASDAEAERVALYGPAIGQLGIADWETTKPWESNADDIASGRAPGWLVRLRNRTGDSAHATSVYRGNRPAIAVSEAYFDSPPASRRSTLYHEAGHTLDRLIGPVEQQLAYDTLLDGPNFAPSRDNPGEMIAEGYALLHTNPQWLADNQPNLLPWLIAQADRFGMPVPEAARNVEPQQFLFRNGDIVDDVLRIPEGVTFEDRSGAMFERTRTGARSMRNGQDVTAGYLSGVETSNGDPITNPARPQFTIRDDVPAPRPDTTPDNTPPLGLTGAALDAAVTESLDRTDPEYRDWATPEIMAQFADDVRSGAVVNVPHTVLPAILADGRVKSTHEINGDLTAERVDYEATFMGIPADTPNHLRPVYGTTAARIGDGSDYGDIVLFVNPDRKDVSFTGGDSLTFNAVPIFPDDVAGASPDRLMAAVGEEGGYLETQILGGLPLSDVTKIVVPGTTPDGSPIPDYRAMLDEAGFPGIAVETYKARYAPTGTMPIYGDFTTLTPLGATGDTPGAWKLTKESVTDEAGVQGTQAAEFAQRLVDTPSAAVTPTQIEFEGDSYSVYPDGRVTNADGTAASDYMAGVVREELRRRDTYGSDRYGPPPTTAQEARDAGYTEGPYWHATSPIAAEKILSDGFLAPGAEDWELDNDGTIEEWDKDGSTRPVYFGNTPEEVAGYGETAVPLMIRPGSKRPGTGFVEAFMVDPADAVPLTDVDAPFSAIPDAKKVARELNDRMESVVVGSSYPAIENLIDLADPVPGPLYKGSDNHTFDQMVADGTVTFKTPVSVSSELTGAEMFVDTEPRPLSNEEYLRWANGELPVRRDGYDTTTKPIMFEIMGAKAIDATATIESLHSTGDWDIRTDMFETSTTSTDLSEDLGWKAASQTSEWIAAAGDYRVVSVDEHDGYRYVRIEAATADPEPDAPTLPAGGTLSPELAAVVALLDGSSTDFDNEDELVMDLGMALFTKGFGDGQYQAEFENGMISLHDESAKFDGIIYDNETFTNLGTFSRALSIDDETGVVEMYHDVFRLNPDAQGKGIGSMFTAAQLDSYRAAGIDRVRTTAASGTSYDDDGVEYPGMRMNGAYTWAVAGFDWDPDVGYQDANNIGRKILRLDPESKLGAALVAWRGGEPDDTVPIPFDVAADPVGKRVLLGDMGGDQLEPMTWMAVLPLTERGGTAVRQPTTDAGRAKRDGVPLTAPETPAPAIPDVAAPDVPEPQSTVGDRIRQESLFAEDFGFSGTAAPTLFDPDAPPVERGPLVVGDLDGLGDALDRIEITANGDRFTANLDAEDVATVKRYAAQLFAHRGDYANSTVESVRPTALADGTPAFIVDGLITSESGFPIGSWQRQIAADRSTQPPGWAVRGTDLRMGEDNRGLGYGMWFVAESETALRDAGFDHVITDAVSDPGRDLNGAYTMATAGYDWDTSPEGVDLVRALGESLLEEDEDSWLGQSLAGWDGQITEDLPTPLDVALDPDGFELLRHGEASWIGRRSLQDPNRTDLPPLEDPEWLGTRADVSVPELLSESAPFRAFSPGVQAALENVASQWYDHDLGDGYTSEVVGVSFARNSAGGLPVTVMGVIRDGDGNRIGEFTRALHRVNVDDLMEPVADGDDIVINHEYLSIGVAHQGKGLGSRFMAASLDAYQGHGIDVVTTNAMTDPLENLNGAYTWAVAGFDWDPASWSLAQEIGAHMLNADPDSVVGRMLVDDYNPDTSPTPLDVAMDPVGKLVLKGEPGVVSWNGVLPVNPGAARREPVTPAGRDRAGLTPPRPVPVSAADVGEFLAYTFANPDNPPTEAETRDAMALLYEHTLPNGYRTTVTEAKIRPGQFTGINVDGAIYESDGTLVGHFSRTIGESSDGLTARHESISLKEYHQGKGVGAQLTASVFDAYRDAGIAKVKTDAASTGTDAMNGAYTWAVAGFDWDPDDSKTLDKMHDIGNRMLRSDPDSALGQALVDTTSDNLADSPTPLDIALDPTGGNVLKGGTGNLVWPGVYYPSGDRREPITNPARERLGLPTTSEPLTPTEAGTMLREALTPGSTASLSQADADRIAASLFDHDLPRWYRSTATSVKFSTTPNGARWLDVGGEIATPDGVRVGKFERQIEYNDGYDRFEVQNLEIAIDEPERGNGLGAAFTSATFDAFREAGMDKVTVVALSTRDKNANGAYTWAVAGFDWDPDDPKMTRAVQNIGQQMLAIDPESAIGQALSETSASDITDATPTPLDVAMDPIGKRVLLGETSDNTASWPGRFDLNGDRREPVTNPARERLGLDPIAAPTPAVPNTDDTADGTVPFDPNEPIPLTPRVGARLMELGHSGYDNEKANAEATAIAKALFDHDLGDGYSTRIVTASSRSTVEQQGIVAADGEILGPDGTRVGTFSRQFRPMLFGTNGDGADRVPEVVWETPPQVSPIEGMELGETKSFAAADLPATLMPGTVISMTSASGSTLTGSVTDNGQIRFNDNPSLGMAWASTLGEFATEVPGRNRLRDAWSADGTVTITLPDSIPDEKRTVWNVTPDPDVGLGVVNDTLKIDLAHQGKGVGSRFVAASENGYAQIGVDQAIVHAVTRNYPTDPEDARYNGAYTWAKGGGYDFVAKGDFVDGVDMVRTLGRRMIQLDETSQMGALLSEWNGRDRDNIPTPLEVALDPTGAAALKDSEYSQWWGAKPLSDRFKAMQRAQREQSLTAPAELPAPKITNDDTTVGGDVPFDLDQPIPLTSRVKARLAHLSEHGTDGKASNHPELLAIARAVFNQDDIGGGIRASVTGVYNLNGEGGTLDVNGILVNSSGRQIGFFDRRFRPMSAGDLNAVDVETVMVETPQPQVSPLPGVGLGETTRHSLIDLPENLPEGTVLTWTKTGGPHSPTMQYRAVRRPWGSYDVEATGPTGDVSPMPSMKLEDFRLDAARLSDDSTADLTLPDVIPPVVSAQHTVTPRPNAGYGVQNYSIEIADEFQRQGIGSRFIAASEESYAKVGFDQTVVHAVGDGSRFNGAYTWAKACVPMRARMLTQRGWLSWHEIDAATDLAAQWDNGDLRWLPIVSVDRYGSRETITFGKHGWSFTATGNHRVLASVGVESGQSRSPRSPRLARLDELMPKFGTYSRASILTAAPLVAGDRSGLSPDQAALLGWLITDGSVVIRQRGVSGQHVEVAATITQSKELGRKEISALLERMGGWSGRWMDGPTRSAVNVPTRHVRELHSVVGVPAIVGVGATDRLKAGLSDVVLRMGHEQLAAFVRAAELAEGASGFLGDDAEHPGNRRRMWQNPGACNDALRLAFFLAGNRIGKSVPRRGSTNESWAVSAATIPTQSLAVTGRTTEETWCPHTTTGTWVCELDGIMSITGNSGYDWMHDPSGFGQAMLERDPNSEIGKRLAEFDGGEDWSGVPTPLEVALDPIGKELLLNGNVEWWGTKPLSDEFKAIAAARRQPTPGAPDTPVAPTTAPEDLPINFGRWSVGEMVDADDINLLPEGTDFSAGFDSYTALGGDTFDNDGTTITGERLRRQLDGDQVYIDSLPGNSGPPAPTPDPVPDAPEPAVDTPDAPATVGERRLPGWYLARMGNDITVEGANGTRATGQISTVSQDTRRGDTVTISTADGPRSFPVNTTIVVGSTGVEPWADGGMVARYRNRDYRIDSDGNVTKADDYNASIAKSTATGVKNAAIADATERFTDATPEPAPAPTPAPDPVPDVPNMPEPAPEVPEPVAPGTPEVPTLPTGGRDFAVARPEHVLNVGYSDGAIIEQLKQLPKGAGRQYTVTDAAGNRFRMVGKDERGLRYQMLAANDDTVVGEWIMLPAEAPFTISDVVPGTYDETFAGSDAAITRLGDEMLAKNPDLAPIVWSDISPAAWLDMSTEEQAQNGMPDAEQGQALRSAITRFLGEAQRAVVRVGDTSLSEREYLPYRFYKVESATVPTREYGAETTGAAKVLWTTEPPTPDAPAFKLTRAQLDSALDSDEPGRPDFVWTGQVRAPEWDAPVPDNPRTEEQRSAAVQKLATNIFPVDIPIWEADRLEEALPMGPKGMLIDALTRGGYATPTDPAFQSLRVPVNGVVIRQDGSVQWSLSAPGEGDLSAPRLYDGDVTYSIDDPLLPQAVAAATQRNQATQLSQILNGRQQRSGRGRTLGTPAGDYARWVDTQSKQIMDESFTDTTDLAYDQETGAFTRSATPTEYHVNSEQLRRAFADRDEQGNPRLWLNADDRAGVVGIETDYTKVRDKSLPFDDRVAALAEQRTALQRLLPGDSPQTWFSGPATSATITDVIDGTADEQTQRNMQRVAMLQEFGMELHALVSEQFAASKMAAHSVDQADTDKAIAALSTGVFERELRSDVARGEHPVLGRLVAQMDGDPDMADDPFVLEDVKADSDDPTDGHTMTMRRLASGNSVQVKVGRAAIGGPLVTWIAKENQQARAEQIGPVTLHTDGHMADLAQFGDTLRSLNHVTKEADALAEVTAANRGGRRAAVTKAFPPEATRDAMSALLENTPVDRFAFYKFTHDASSGEYQIDGDAAHLSAVTAGTKDGRKNVKLTFVTMLGSPYYERKFTVTINDDNSMTLNKNGSRRAVGRAPANVDSNTYASMAAVVADLKKQAPKADKKDDKPTVDAATVAESTPLKAFHAVMEKMGVDMSTDESLQIGRGGEGPLKPIGEATAGLAETARAGLAVFPRAWTTVLAKNRPIRLQLRRGNVDFRSEGGYNAQPGTRVNPSGPHDLISTPDITLRPDYADVAGHEFGHSFQHVIPGLEKAEQWYLVSRVAASPPEKQKPRVYGTGRRGRTDYVFEDEFARSYTGRTYGSGVSEAREVFTTAVQGMYNDIGGQSGFGADTRLQAWAIAMMALHDPGVGTNTDRAAMTGAQLLGASYSKKDVESLLKSSELTVAQRNELKDILASM